MSYHSLFIRSIAFATTFLVPVVVFASPVISEVLWMGSDLSTSDEWVEITNPEDEPVDLSGFSLWYLTSKGTQGLIVRFSTGTILDAGEVAIVANTAALSSRLLLEPRFVTSSISLPNTKLLLTLQDQHGQTIDEVDDGVGAPFAGANPSGGTKASMERIDVRLPGTDPQNWRTASTASGLDAGANVFATPGEIPDSPPTGGPDGGAGSGCHDSLAVAIYVQDGELRGVGKTTVNFQAVALSGSIAGVPCRWSFSDGYRSESCNPPPHSFTSIGTTIVTLEATNQCGSTLIQTREVLVEAEPGADTRSSPLLTYDAGRIVLVAALPNPDGADSGKEWVRLRNLEDRSVSLDGWTLQLGISRLTTVRLSGVIGPREDRTIATIEQKFSLANTESRIVLRSPDGSQRSLIAYPAAEEGREYYPDDLRSLDLEVRVTRVLDGDTIEVELPYDARALTGEEILRVRLLGIDAPELLLDGTDANLSLSAREFLRDLIEGEKVVLEFDTELWDAYGRLLAYVYDSQGFLTQDRILEQGFASVIERYPLRRMPLLIERQKQAQALERGIWFSGKQSPKKPSSSLASAPTTIISPVVHDSQDAAQALPLRMSEVYSKPTSKGSSDSLGVEWIELWNGGTASITLDGLRFARAGKVRVLPPTVVAPSSYVVVDLSALSLPLPDAGGAIDLLDQSGMVIDAVQFPALKEGMSFALEMQSDSYCTTRTPTPGAANRCTAPLTRSQAAKAAAAKRSEVTYATYAADYRKQLDETSEIVSLEIPIEHTSIMASSSMKSTISFVLGVSVGFAGLFAWRFARLL